tara:strand:+ start:395 stop:622 length:228 start_codon:yes stop_codon:yes gene_type:complete
MSEQHLIKEIQQLKHDISLLKESHENGNNHSSLERRIDELEDNVIQIHEFNIKLAKVVLPNEELPDTPSSLDDDE